jgi:hypothetical protein
LVNRSDGWFALVAGICVALCHRHGCRHPNTVQVTHLWFFYLSFEFFLFFFYALKYVWNVWEDKRKEVFIEEMRTICVNFLMDKLNNAAFFSGFSGFHFQLKLQTN